MRFVLAASLLVLAGCSAHKTETAHSHHGDLQLASTSNAAAGGCHGGAMKAEMASMEDGAHCSAKKAEMASSEGAAHCSAKKVEMASMEEGAHCSAKKAEMASSEGAAHCSAKKAEMASMEDGAKCSAKKAELASAEAAGHCGDCPKKADGSCDHEAGAKAGRECCKNHLAEATATP